MRRAVILGLLVLLGLGCTAALARQERPTNESEGCHSVPRGTGANLTLETLVHDGVKRSYYLHVPPAFHGARSLPVVMVLHGGGRHDGDELAEVTGYNAIADREGFLAVYPNGIENQWNDGRGVTCGKPKKAASLSKVDDVGFLSALIDHLVARHRGDPRRVYVMGLSNGGMMSLRLGCEISEKLAAIAPVIAGIPVNIVPTCTPASPLPVLLMNGTEDPMVPWKGGEVTVLGRQCGSVLSTEATIAFWVKRNGCVAEPEVRSLPDTCPGDGSFVWVSTHAGSPSGAEVVLYAIVGGGHTFPGGNHPELKLLLGNKNRDILANEVIWDFFRRHSR